ncbi:MAG TPA: TetR/AcrR family transcriptional regulator [Burkholderiales bacterium]|jgi:AcrR family transcriptional regulator|nr:TetR/AcrR family transcriptional regulator [Burkholderiales bacterium]
MGAAFHAFTEKGYSRTSTLDIASRAKVSKRELYAHFGSKQDLLVACISARTSRMKPPDLPEPQSHEMLERALTAFGETLLREVSHPLVLAMFRLAIAESGVSPRVARSLETQGRGPARSALANLIGGAQAKGLLAKGDAEDLARDYLGLLWQDLMVGLLLKVAKPPSVQEMRRRAAHATASFVKLAS